MSDETPRPEDEAVRRMLRDLPEVSPPEGWLDALIRRRQRRARALAIAGFAAAALVGAIVVGHATGITGEVVPRMNDLVGAHQDLVGGGEATVLSAPASDDDVPAPYQAPEDLGPMERGAAMVQDDEGIQLVYSFDGHVISVFERAGDLDEGDLGDELTPMADDTWMAHEGDLVAVVVRRHDVVYVVIGDATPEELVAVAEDLPDARPLGLSRRIGDAMDDLVITFGLG